MDRHDEPDRAALRHRSGPAAHQGRAAGGRQLPITGQKIFISAGDHDMSETSSIWCWPRHRAAAKGTKGISLFIVPKFLVNDDGSLGRAQRGQSVGKIEEKMGIHGNATCVMNYDGATGWLWAICTRACAPCSP
jgi:alkylation response protein AidB-like acyl-CoA dehydrogenase